MKYISKLSLIRAASQKKRVYIPLFLSFSILLGGCGGMSQGAASGGGEVVKGSDLNVIGRFSFSEDRVELVSSGAHFEVSFSGTSCAIVASIAEGAPHNYLQYEVDDVYWKRIKIEGSSADTTIIRVTGEGQHKLKVFKATEAHTGPIFIHSLLANQIAASAKGNVPVIEFVGNSITCGAAADPSEVPCGEGYYHDQHNAYFAYGPRVARELKAEFILSSVSGIGMYRTWNSDGPAMPEVYEKLDFISGSNRPWDFGEFRPAVVAIALGTNDFSHGDGKHPRLPFDSSVFVSEYVKFIGRIGKIYPDVSLVLLNSPMISGEGNTLLIRCLQAVKLSVEESGVGAKIQIFEVTPLQPHGCTYHPSVEDHAVLAAELTPLFRNMLR